MRYYEGRFTDSVSKQQTESEGVLEYHKLWCEDDLDKYRDLVEEGDTDSI